MFYFLHKYLVRFEMEYMFYLCCRGFLKCILVRLFYFSIFLWPCLVSVLCPDFALNAGNLNYLKTLFKGTLQKTIVLNKLVGSVMFLAIKFDFVLITGVKVKVCMFV